LEKTDTRHPKAPEIDISLPARAARTAPGMFSSFKHPNYRLWFGGQLVSVVGTWMQIIAQGWLVYEISHSEFALGAVGFASAIPVLLITPWGGVVTDLIPRRTLLVITQASAMLLAFVLSILAFTGLVQVWHILIMAALLGVVNSFDAPARLSFVVDMVGREDMTNAIALNSMMFNGARIAGPATAGILLAAFGPAWCFLINGFSFLAVIASLLAMRFPRVDRQPPKARPWQQFTEGLRYARSHGEIVALLGLAAIFSVFGFSYNAILPAFVDKILHAGADGYGHINALVGAGAVTGALAMARFGGSGKRGRILFVANLLYPLGLVAFAYNTHFQTALFLSFGLGVGFMLVLNSLNSLLQVRVNDAMRGRVLSLFTLSFFGFSPFGNLAVGAAAEHLPMNLTLAISAGVTLALSLLVYWLVPQVRKLA